MPKNWGGFIHKTVFSCRVQLCTPYYSPFVCTGSVNKLKVLKEDNCQPISKNPKAKMIETSGPNEDEAQSIKKQNIEELTFN